MAISGHRQNSRDTQYPDIILWNFDKEEKISSFPADGVDVNDLAFSPDGRVLAVTSKTDVKLWNVATRALEATLVGDGLRHIICVAFSPDGKLLGAGTTYTIRPLRDAKVMVWEVPSGSTGSPEKN